MLLEFQILDIYVTLELYYHILKRIQFKYLRTVVMIEVIKKGINYRKLIVASPIY